MSDSDGFTFVRTDDLAWRPSKMGAGILVKDVAVAAGWEMQIVRVEPGARFPVHAHEGPEFLYILEGSSFKPAGVSGPVGRASPAPERSMRMCTRRRVADSCWWIARDRR